MYVYLVTLHPSKEGTGIKAAPGPFPFHESSRPVPNLQLRADPVPTDDMSEQFSRLGSLNPDGVIGFQTYWMEESLESATVAQALASYYSVLFPRLTFMEGDAYVGGTDTPTSFEVAVDRIEIPRAFTREYVEKQVMQIEVSQLPKLKLVFSNQDPSCEFARFRVASGLATPPALLKTKERIHLLVTRLKAWAAAEVATEAWTRSFGEAQKGDIVGAPVAVAGDSNVCDYADAFNSSTIATRVNPPLPAFAIANATKTPTPYVFDIPNRQVKVKNGGTMTAALLRLWKGGAMEEWTADSSPLKFDRVILPCDVTPFLGTEFCSEVAVQEIHAGFPNSSATVPILSATVVQKFEEARAEAAAAALKKWNNSPAVDAHPTVVASGGTPLVSTSKFPHEAELGALWAIFKNEYVQRKKVEGSAVAADAMALPRGMTRDGAIQKVASTWGRAVPMKLFLTAWKLFASQPKASTLGRLPHFAESLLGPKPMPVDWSKVITSEVLTEWFYNSKGDILGAAPHSIPFLSRMVNMQVCALVDTLYRKKIPSDFIDLTPEEYAAFDSLDYTPVLEVILKQQLSEASKAAWVKAFIRETLTYPVEGSTVGSAEMHTSFLSWVRPTLFMVEQGVKEGMVAQFPIAELTRLMKAAGFEMTRRSRGMVYLNVAQKGASHTFSKMSDDDTKAYVEAREAKEAASAAAAAVAAETPSIAKMFASLPRDERIQGTPIGVIGGSLFAALPQPPPPATLTPPDYAAMRDSVCAEQTAVITGEAPAPTSGTLLADLEGFAPEEMQALI